MSYEARTNFQLAGEMPYANSEQIKEKAQGLILRLKEHLRLVNQDEDLFFENNETVYIPDIHGDFVHLIITLHRHGLLDNKLNLKNNFQYVFLGDFYDRAPDSDVIDFWFNNQIQNKLKIYRLIGNHEMAFFERDVNGHPLMFPSQDSIKDISYDFQITGEILKNIKDGNILAAYVSLENPLVLYVHSYVICEDFTELGLEKDTDIVKFALALNKRFKKHGEYAYNLFCEQKRSGQYNWKAIMHSYYEDPLFNLYKKKNDISTSFVWRRTGLSVLKIFPNEIDVEIPNNVYQIVGHTPIFSFDLPMHQAINTPIIVSLKNSSGKVQFSDVGIGYYYKNEFERPEVIINKKFAMQV